MSETLAIGQLTDQHIGRTIAINDAAGRLAEGRLVGVHSMLVAADRVVRICLEEDGRMHEVVTGVFTLLEVQP